MVKEEKTGEEIQDSILHYLWQQNAWGERYKNFTDMVKRVSSVVINNGKNTRKQVKILIKNGLVLIKKQGRTISLDPHYKTTIRDRLIEADYHI